MERFVSLRGDPFDGALPTPRLSGADRTVRVEVELDSERHCFDWPSDRRLLDVLTGNGLAAPASCGEGICAACECQVVEGEVRMAGNLVLTDEDLANGYALAYQAVPVSDLVRISYD